MIIFALLLGLILRIYNFSTTYYFSGELGKEMLYIRQFSLLGKLPLMGMTTSHEWLSYGPFYYWITIPIFNLFHGNPYILFWTAIIVSMVGLLVSYFVVLKIAGKKVASLSVILMSVSPLLVWQTRNAKLHVFFFILIPLFTYLLYLIWNGKKKWVFWAGIIFGFMFSFHFSQIPLIGVVILLFWIKKNIYKFADWVKFALGVLIPNLSLIWQDKNLALWLPYRTLNLSEKDPFGTLQSLTEYFGRNLFTNHDLWILGFIIFICVFAHYVYTERRKISKDFLTFYLISSISLMIAANILHGAPLVHYFLPIYTTVPILYSVYLSKVKWGIILLMLVFIINLRGYMNLEKAVDYIPYSSQVNAANFIVSDASERQFSINRIGLYDYFPEHYSQNYKYLVLWKGGNLVENATLIYTIVEKGENVNVRK